MSFISQFSRRRALGRLAVAATVWAGLGCAQTPPPTPAPATLAVTGDVATALTLKPEDLAAMPREKVMIPDQDGTQVEYEGVPLREILKRAGAPLGNQLRGSALTKAGSGADVWRTSRRTWPARGR